MECRKVYLAGGVGCKVMYCEQHQVAELEVGALSLRLELSTFLTLEEVMATAAERITVLTNAKAEQTALFKRVFKS